MCFFAFLSYYIATEAMDRLAIDTLGYKGARSAIKKAKNTIFFVASRDRGDLLAPFTNAASIFNKDTHFAIISGSTMNKLLKTDAPDPPALLIYENGELLTSITAIGDETQLLTVLDLALKKQRPLLTSTYQLLANLGNSDTTIVTTNKNFDKAFKIFKECSHTTGTINILTVTGEVLKEMQAPENGFVLHRTLDDNIEFFDGTKSSFLAKSAPSFREATLSRLHQVKGETIIVYSPVLFNDQKELLSELGKHYTDIQFFHLSYNRLAEDLESQIDFHFTTETSSYVIYMNPFFNYYYNLTGRYQPDPPRTRFNGQKATEQIVEIIKQRYLSKLQKVYISEDSNDYINQILTRVAGKKYHTFLNDTRDTLILYLNAQKPESTKIYKKFMGFSDRFFEHFRNFKMGIIEVTKNGVEGGFPVYDTPQIAFFPGHDKEHPKFLIGSDISTNDMSWLIYLYSNNTYGLEPKVPSKDAFKKMEDSVKENLKKMNPVQRIAMNDLISKLSEYVEGKKSIEKESKKEKIKLVVEEKATKVFNNLDQNDTLLKNDEVNSARIDL